MIQQPLNPSSDPGVLQPLDNSKAKSRKIILAVYILLVILGVGTGYLLTKKSTGFGGPTHQVINTGKIVGSTDTKAFPDSAQGVIEKGGLDGEGTHHLTRDGGPSQTVYLTSSVVDLDEFVGKKVKVAGQTLAAQKAAWLMDVGKVEILN